MATNFREFASKDVLVDSTEILEQYDHGIGLLHRHLSQLHLTLLILDKVIEFPREVFLPRDAMFLPMVIANFKFTAIAVAHRLSIDHVAGAFTLKRFKNWVKGNVRGEYRHDFKVYVNEHDFDEQSDLFVNIRNLRNAGIAHFVKDDLDAPNLSDVKDIDMPELWEAAQTLARLINALSFNNHRMMLPLAYNPSVQWPPHSESTTDIDIFLDRIARDSYLLNEPEADPEIWRRRREILPPHTLETVNRYRQKFGLPEA